MCVAVTIFGAGIGFASPVAADPDRRPDNSGSSTSGAHDSEDRSYQDARKSAIDTAIADQLKRFEEIQKMGTNASAVDVYKQNVILQRLNELAQSR
jgi:hypothetical protein